MMGTSSFAMMVMLGHSGGHAYRNYEEGRMPHNPMTPMHLESNVAW